MTEENTEENTVETVITVVDMGVEGTEEDMIATTGMGTGTITAATRRH